MASLACQMSMAPLTHAGMCCRAMDKPKRQKFKRHPIGTHSPTSWTHTTSHAAKDLQRPHALRIHLQNLDFRTRSIQLRSEPLNAGTEQLELPIVPQDLWEAAKARQESRINKQTKPTASSRELQLSARSDGWRGRNRAARASSLDWKTNS